jgi:iron complex outermembrane receptor protein
MWKTLKLSLVFVMSFSCQNVFSENSERDIFSLSLQELMAVSIVTAASGYEQNIIDAPASVTIIHRNEWVVKGASNLHDAITSVTGIHITLQTVGTESEYITLRGLGGDANGAQVKLLIDGLPLESRRVGGRATGGAQMPLNGFKRIEIVKGPGSVIYGADAFAGVINLVSEDAGDDTNNNITATVGRYDKRESNINYGGRFKALSYYVTLGREQRGVTNRFIPIDAQADLDKAPLSQITPDASNAPGVLDDWYETTNLLLKANYQGFAFQSVNYIFDGGNTLGVSDRLEPTDKESGNFFVRHNIIHAEYELNRLSDRLPGILKLEANYERTKTISKLMVFPPDAVLLIGENGNLFTDGGYPAVIVDDGLRARIQTKSDNRTFKVNHVFRANQQHGIRWELGYEEVKILSALHRMYGFGLTDAVTMPRPTDGSPLILGTNGLLTNMTYSPENQVMPPEVGREFWFVSIQDEWKASDDISVSLGLRYDEYSDFGGTTNPRVGVSWRVSEELKIKTFLGTSFRAPTLDETYLKNNPIGLGNLNLDPETITMYEVGFNYGHNNIILSGSVFHYKTEDIIAYVQDTNLLSKRNNTSGTTGDGIELDFRWKPIPNISVYLGYSYTDMKDENKNPVADLPNTFINVGLNWLISDSYNANLSARHVAGRERARNADGSEFDAREKMDDYTSITARVAWLISDKLTFSVSGSNLTNDYISEPGPSFLERDIPMVGRQYKVELNYKF